VTEAWSADGSGLSRLRRIKCCRDRLGIDDGARKQHGDRASHGEGSDGAHGMRGHRLGVGDVGAVSCLDSGIRASEEFVVTAGSRAGSMSQAWSVDRDAISSAAHLQSSRDGSASVTVHGAGLGLVRHSVRGERGTRDARAPNGSRRRR
jgi:hypothetical protein